MIPFGSQRALGQDLATHLLNAQDNERLEVAQVRGPSPATCTAPLPNGRRRRTR